MGSNSYKKVIFIMGVSGSGKSYIGRLLARELSVPFIEGDDHHPTANIDKMRQGIPLEDSDREPWLGRLHELAISQLDDGCVISCSALKEKYRKTLSKGISPHTELIYLKGSYDLIYERMSNRKGHFMDPKMLQSQFNTLEEPLEAITIDIAGSPQTIIQKIKSQLA